MYIDPTEPSALGHPANRPYSAAWYMRFRREEQRSEKMSGEADFSNDPDWLMLPLARREVALHRWGVMLDYERHADPGEPEAQKAAGSIGVTTGQFYRLRRRWLEGRSIFSLVPYGTPGTARKPKLDKDVSDAVTDLVTTAITKGGFRSHSQILKFIQNEWSLDKPIPSHMTLRKGISLALEDLTDVSGNLLLDSAIIPQNWIQSAKGYGDAVVVDHQALQVFVASEGGPVAPIATLVIDLYTSSIFGFHLSFGAPGSLQFEAALRDAEKRSLESRVGSDQPIAPRLAFQCGGGSDWSKILDRIAKSETVANVVRAQRPSYGDTITRLIGGTIGDVKLTTRRYLNDLVFNPVRDPLIDLDELRSLMEAGVAAINVKRIPPDTRAVAIRFDFLTVP